MCTSTAPSRFPACRRRAGWTTAFTRPVRSVEALSLWLHHQIMSRAFWPGSLRNLETDLAVEEPQARLPTIASPKENWAALRPRTAVSFFACFASLAWSVDPRCGRCRPVPRHRQQGQHLHRRKLPTDRQAGPCDRVLREVSRRHDATEPDSARCFGGWQQAGSDVRRQNEGVECQAERAGRLKDWRPCIRGMMSRPDSDARLEPGDQPLRATTFRASSRQASYRRQRGPSMQRCKATSTRCQKNRPRRFSSPNPARVIGLMRLLQQRRPQGLRG